MNMKFGLRQRTMLGNECYIGKGRFMSSIWCNLLLQFLVWEDSLIYMKNSMQYRYIQYLCFIYIQYNVGNINIYIIVAI
jgi:hypothetical protein